MRSEKELLIATKAFASERRFVSWWVLWSTLSLYFASLFLSLSDVSLALRVASSLTNGLLIVRLFIIYHDYQHHAILSRSYLADMIMYVYGLFVLSPPSVWNRSHDHHHKHNSKEMASGIGSFPIMSTTRFADASLVIRLQYCLARHPLTITLGYLTVFMYGMCLRAAVINPREHFDAVVAMVLHLGLAVLALYFGLDIFLLGLILPLTIACGLGSYLFYAQHNFPGCRLNDREDWSHASAALKSSSFIEMSSVMRWFTGNIGYHHVHHLNAKIPFYRLLEAVAALPELQRPASTTLLPQDVFACFQLNLWDPKQQKFVSYREARLLVKQA
jgi:acyl-lipid omega-6 desaturase (Delta-12 desaturase)